MQAPRTGGIGMVGFCHAERWAERDGCRTALLQPAPAREPRPAPPRPARLPILLSATSRSPAATSPTTMHSAVCAWMPLAASTTSTIRSMIWRRRRRERRQQLGLRQAARKAASKRRDWRSSSQACLPHAMPPATGVPPPQPAPPVPLR